jgi:hypothetical protein
MDPVPDPLLLKKSGSAGSVARNSDLYTTEAVFGSIPGNHYSVLLSVLLFLLQQLSQRSQIVVLLGHFMIMETGTSRVMISLRNVAHATKLSHCA